MDINARTIVLNTANYNVVHNYIAGGQFGPQGLSIHPLFILLLPQQGHRVAEADPS